MNGQILDQRAYLFAVMQVYRSMLTAHATPGKKLTRDGCHRTMSALGKCGPAHAAFLFCVFGIPT